MEKYFYSNGKLLLTGEYLILNGAKALALPVKYGQSMEVEYSHDPDSFFVWETKVEGKTWFTTTIPKFVSDFPPKGKTKTESWLLNLLYSAQHIAENFNPLEKIVKITCNINYNILWGLGSSSGIISNVAYLFNIDPFLLFNVISNGSGYDIACARNNTPLLYQLKNNKPEFTPCEISPKISPHLYFIYSGRKQKTEQSVRSYKKEKKVTDSYINKIAEITDKFYQTESFNELKELIVDHENIVGKVLNENPLKQSHFPDFEGELKSLGAWGGDFFMAATNQGGNYVDQYFKKKKLDVVFSYDNIILK